MMYEIGLMRHNNTTDKNEYFTYKDIGTLTEVINGIVKFVSNFTNDGKPWSRWSVESFTTISG